jgi:hypothetical protein
MTIQLVKVKGVRVGADGKPVEVEDLMPVSPPPAEPVKLDIADLIKLIAYAKTQGWI